MKKHEIKRAGRGRHSLTTGLLAAALTLGAAGSALAVEPAALSAQTGTGAASGVEKAVQSGNTAEKTTESGVGQVATAAATDSTSHGTPDVPSFETNVDAAKLLPGDYFYFAKTMYERVRLSLAGSDISQAQLLTQFAKGRLAEAEALFAKGKPDLARDVLEKALKTQQKAVDKADAATNDATNVSLTPAASSPDAATAPSTPTAPSVTPAQPDGEQTKTVKTDLQHNIVALSAALERVGNPNAQQAIMRNIEKAYGHLEKKLEKLEAKASKHHAEHTSEQQAPQPSPAPTANPQAGASKSPSVTPATQQDDNDDSDSINTKRKDAHHNQKTGHSHESRENGKQK